MKLMMPRAAWVRKADASDLSLEGKHARRIPSSNDILSHFFCCSPSQDALTRAAVSVWRKLPLTLNSFTYLKVLQVRMAWRISPP